MRGNLRLEERGFDPEVRAKICFIMIVGGKHGRVRIFCNDAQERREAMRF